ncbi:MAG: hypothetical protein GKR88_18270 [Flavobacteriaceae bacterium]|nr:MAG: hypothetical protein GKR88_18270 [Flavobacteriaceae bacterium]
MATHKKQLVKGLKYLGVLILLFIVSPVVLSISYKALHLYKEGYQYMLSIGAVMISFLLLLFTVFFAFKTFKIIVSAIFDSK